MRMPTTLQSLSGLEPLWRLNTISHQPEACWKDKMKLEWLQLFGAFLASGFHLTRPQCICNFTVFVQSKKPSPRGTGQFPQACGSIMRKISGPLIASVTPFLSSWCQSHLIRCTAHKTCSCIFWHNDPSKVTHPKSLFPYH